MGICKYPALMAALLLAGCNAGEIKDLRSQNQRMQYELATIKTEMVLKQRRIETAHRILAEVYGNLQRINLSQANIVEYTGDIEAAGNKSFLNMGEDCNRMINEIDSCYRVNRNKIDSLNQFNDLHLVTINKLVETNNELKRVNEKLRQKIVELVGIIEVKEAEINRVYYLVGSEDMLLSQGIIRHRGLYGFRVHEVAYPISYSMFDSTAKQNCVFTTSRKIIDVLPHRNTYTYAISNNGHRLTVCEDNTFWQSKQLVIVTE